MSCASWGNPSVALQTACLGLPTLYCWQQFARLAITISRSLVKRPGHLALPAWMAIKGSARVMPGSSSWSLAIFFEAPTHDVSIIVANVALWTMLLRFTP